MARRADASREARARTAERNPVPPPATVRASRADLSRVANMYFIPVGILLQQVAGLPGPDGAGPTALGWSAFLVRNLLPVSLGNILGGGLFVAMGYWGAYLRNPKQKQGNGFSPPVDRK